MDSLTAEEYKNKGNNEFRNSNFEAAVDYFTQGLKHDASHHVLYSNRSACYASLSKWTKALADAEKCIELSPKDWSKGYVRLGAALHGLGRIPEAIKAYEKGLDIDPENQVLQQALENLKKNAPLSEEGSPFAQLFRPETWMKIQTNPRLAPYLKQPDYVQIIRTLIDHPSMIQGFMKDQRVMQTIIELLGLSGATSSRSNEKGDEDVPRATDPSDPLDLAKTEDPPKTDIRKDLKQPFENPQNLAMVAKEKGNRHYKKREFDEALRCYEEAISLDPSNGSFYLNKTAVYVEQEKYSECLTEIETIMERYEAKTIQNPDFVFLGKVLTRKAQVFEKQKYYSEAIQTYQSALREHRNADTLKKLKNCEDAKKKAEVEAYYDPELGNQEKIRGNDLFAVNKYPEAIKTYTEAIKRNPSDHTVYSNRAAAYMKLGAYDEAVKDCDTCLGLEPTFLKAIVRLGHCYFWRKEYHKAAQTYEKGLGIDSNNAQCKEGLYRTQMKIAEAMHTGEIDEERIARAKADPEIQQILSDSYIQLVLREMSLNSSRAEEYMKDPTIASKIQKLILAGVLSIGPQKGKPSTSP